MKYFVSYATANDDPRFLVDFLNFKNFVCYPSGVDEINIAISVSNVNRCEQDILEFGKSVRILQKSQKFNLLSLRFKKNLGRDFSSHACNLRDIAHSAEDDDYVLFLNRSAYGPNCSDWYLKYVEQFEKHENTGLCGSTINFRGLPRMEDREIYTHVQTYAFLSKFKFLQDALSFFPGEFENERHDVIEYGEIGLSKEFLKKGLSLSCLAWPEYSFDKTKLYSPELPFRDIKKEVHTPFRHRCEGYVKNRSSIFMERCFRNIL